MTYPPNNPGHYPPEPPTPPTPTIPIAAVPPASRRTPVPWIVGGVVAVVAICCGGFVAIGVLAPTPEEPATDKPAAAVAPPQTSPTPTPAPTTAPAATKPAPTRVVPPTAVMPRLVGVNAAVAVDRLERLGFARENIRLGTQDPYDNWVLLPENWTVAKQSERPGTRVPLDSVIALTCTKLR